MGELDFIFIQHSKDPYLIDLLLLEKSGLIKKGTVVVAYNVAEIPSYIKYLKENPKWRTSEIDTQRMDSEGQTMNELMSISTYGD